MSASHDLTSPRTTSERPPLPGWALLGLMGLVSAGWAVSIWVACHTRPDQVLRQAALFAHLASLVVGLGAVVVVDWFALAWLLGRRALADVLHVAQGGHLVVWLGLGGLLLSGALLAPDMSSDLTQLKMGLVLVVALNGVNAHAIHQRLDQLHGRPVPPRLFARAAVAGLVSQAGWWGAVLAGFVNAQPPAGA